MNREPFFTRLAHSVIMTVCTLVIVLALILGGVWLATNKDKKIEDGSWLVLDLYGEVHEYDPPGGPLGAVMSGEALTLQDIPNALRGAFGYLWGRSTRRGPSRLGGGVKPGFRVGQLFGGLSRPSSLASSLHPAGSQVKQDQPSDTA